METLMHEAKRTNPDFLNGVPELLILKLLARKPMHGYELVQNIKMRTDSVLEFGEGCIYPILHRLECARLLTSRRETVGGRSRVVYRPTPAGLSKLEVSVSAWRHVVEAVERILKGDADVEPANA
jgi:PadR family transcriptional regulator PadR